MSADHTQRDRGKRQYVIQVPAGTRPTSDKMAILLSELQAATATTNERRSGHWIAVHWRQWRAILGRRYATIIREAVKLAFLEVNNRYSTGRFSKSIRLAKPFRTPRTTPYRTGRTTSELAKDRVRLEPEDATGIKLAARFDSVTIPDSVRARGWDSFCVNSIRRRSWYAVRCPYRRFHSTFTGLPKRIRSALRIEEEEVVETDVRNCQPMILGLLVAHHTHTPTQTIPHPTPQPSPHTPPPTTYTICRAFQDLRRFLELCSGGRLYEHLLDVVGGMTLLDCLPDSSRHRFADRPLRRPDIKRQFLILMFAKNETMQKMPLFNIVAREWPSLAAFMLEAKRAEYQTLARDCQRFESRLMIDGVAAELVGQIPILTIHDSIISAVSHQQLVADTIRRHFAQFGLSVTVSSRDPIRDRHQIQTTMSEEPRP